MVKSTPVKWTSQVFYAHFDSFCAPLLIPFQLLLYYLLNELKLSNIFITELFTVLSRQPYGGNFVCAWIVNY